MNQNTNPNAKGPLSGVKVVDLSLLLPGPLCSQHLADMGAEVIKVENPRAYDGSRAMFKGKTGYPALFMMLNRNKKAITLNLKREQAKEILFKLLEDADILLEGFRPDGMDKMGIGYDVLKEKFPRLIYCCNTGYGTQGKEALRPGFDQATFWARTGGTVDWGERGAAPIRPSLGFGDMATAAQVLTGMLAALIARDRTGKGTLVETSLMACGMWYNSSGIVSAQDCYGYEYPEDRTNPTNPFTGFYQGKDGEWFTVVAFASSGGNIGLLKRMFPVFGFDDWICELNAGTFDHDNSEIISRLRSTISLKSCAEWYSIFDSYDVTYEPCAHLRDLSKDEQAWVNGYLEEVTFQNGNKAVLTTVPIKFSAYETKRIRPVGPIGEETCDIMRDAGYSDNEIERLIQSGAVKKA